MLFLGSPRSGSPTGRSRTSSHKRGASKSRTGSTTLDEEPESEHHETIENELVLSDDNDTLIQNMSEGSFEKEEEAGSSLNSIGKNSRSSGNSSLSPHNR